MMSIRQQLLDATDELDGIARAVRSLVPSWQRPENFHEAKSDCVARINKLTASLRRSGVIAAAPVRIVVERIVERERIVTVPARLHIRRRNIFSPHRAEAKPICSRGSLYERRIDSRAAS
jgi:hypothetical protein